MAASVSYFPFSKFNYREVSLKVKSNSQKQPSRDVLSNSISKSFREIPRKTSTTYFLNGFAFGYFYAANR